MRKPDHDRFWHWNLKRRGATGFGLWYVTLQRYLHFNGVMDRYLKDVIGDIWPTAARSFWEHVKQRYDAEHKGTETQEYRERKDEVVLPRQSGNKRPTALFEPSHSCQPSRATTILAWPTQDTVKNTLRLMVLGQTPSLIPRCLSGRRAISKM